MVEIPDLGGSFVRMWQELMLLVHVRLRMSS
jgi:hypothetical protein